jgi:N-acyl-D-amino-acid deacylase
MKFRSTVLCLLIGFCLSLVADAQQDVARPITGKAVEKFAAFDPVINAHMDHIGATAASFAVSLNGKIVYSRAYGWSDSEMKIPATPETTFRIASNTKPITAAIIRQLIAKKRDLKLSTKVIPFLDIKPKGGKLGDIRLNDITIEHLIAHKGGWDKSKTFDPTYRPKTISKAHGIEVGELTKEHIVSYMLSHPLQTDPGEKFAYANFGYMLLGLVIEKVTEKSYAENVVEFASKLKAEIRISATKVSDRHENEVHYPRESGLTMPLRDSLGGLTASSESLCKFLIKHWTNGKRRKKKEKRNVYHFGSHARSTNSLVEQRKDGVDYALVFNACRDKGYTDDLRKIREDINTTIEEIKRSN